MVLFVVDHFRMLQDVALCHQPREITDGLVHQGDLACIPFIDAHFFLVGGEILFDGYRVHITINGIWGVNIRFQWSLGFQVNNNQQHT